MKLPDGAAWRIVGKAEQEPDRWLILTAGDPLGPDWYSARGRILDLHKGLLYPEERFVQIIKFTDWNSETLIGRRYWEPVDPPPELLAQVREARLPARRASERDSQLQR